jgi:hypothetical protein
MSDTGNSCFLLQHATGLVHGWVDILGGYSSTADQDCLLGNSGMTFLESFFSSLIPFYFS